MLISTLTSPASDPPASEAEPMRWVRFSVGNARPQLGVLVDERLFASGSASLVALLSAGDLSAAAARTLADPAQVFSLHEVRLHAPIHRQPSIRDFMVFEQHVEGLSRLATGRPQVPEVWYRQPLFYFSNPAAVVGPHDEVTIPPCCEVFDFELEVAAVVGLLPSGGPLADLTLEQAESAIAGTRS